MIEVKDERSQEQIVEDNLLSVETILVSTSDLISDRKNFDMIMKIIEDTRELRKTIKKNKEVK